MRFCAVFALATIACAGSTGTPNADPNGPHAANEKVIAHGGTLQLDAWPQNGVEVRGDKVYVWVFLEGNEGTGDALAEQAKTQASELLRVFVDTAAQQLDLQLQALGQEPATTTESDALRGQIATALALGDGERAWQNLMREDQPLCRVFMRFTLGANKLAGAIEASLGSRPHKADVAKKVLASFDPDVR